MITNIIEKSKNHNSLVDHVQSKFCTLVQSTCVDIECGLQQGSVFCSVQCEIYTFKSFFVYSVRPRNKNTCPSFEVPFS